MSYSLIIKEEAAQEAVESYLWYEGKVSGLGEAFLQELDNCYSKILQNPRAFQQQYKTFRQANFEKISFCSRI